MIARQTHQDSLSTYRADEVFRVRRVDRLPTIAVADEIEAPEQAGTLNAADNLVISCERCEAKPEVLTYLSGVFEQALVVDHVDYGQRRSGGDGVSAKSVEVVAVLAEGGRDFRGRNDGGDRVAASHRLPQGNDVRHDVVSLVPPPGIAEPAVSRLHFIGDDEPSGGSHDRRGA